jgi:hypothetical protein
MNLRFGWRERCRSKAGDGNEQGEHANGSFHRW